MELGGAGGGGASYDTGYYGNQVPPFYELSGPPPAAYDPAPSWAPPLGVPPPMVPAPPTGDTSIPPPPSINTNNVRSVPMADSRERGDREARDHYRERGDRDRER